MRTRLLLVFSVQFLLHVACDGDGREPDAIDKMASCNEASPLHVLPVELDDVFAIDPLGGTGGGGHVLPTDHGGFRLRLEVVDEDQWGLPVATELFAPSDGVISHIIWFRLLDTNGDVLVNDYALDFSPCREIQVRFAHLPKLSPRLEAAATDWSCTDETHGSEDQIYRYCEQSVDISVSAGEVLGIAGEVGYGTSLDFGGWDARIPPHFFANPARYRDNSPHGFDTFHVVCPQDLFEPNARDLLNAKVGMSPTINDAHEFVPRTGEPVCGHFAQDVAGTLHGNWFLAGTTDPDAWANQLSMSYYQYDPALQVFARGQGSLNTVQFSPQAGGLINRAFADISPDGNVYCYESDITSGRLLVQMLDASSFRLEEQLTLTCADSGYSLGQAAVDYVR